MLVRAFLLSFIFVFSTVAMQIQEQVNVDLVEVYVSALNSDDLPVMDLSEADFTVKENGVTKKISYFTRLLDAESQIPLTIAFLLDTSGSMGRGAEKLKKIDIALNFVSLFLNEIKASDKIQVFAFDNVYRVLTPMTSDLKAVQQALSKVNIDTTQYRGTALLASLDLTIKQLEPHFGRKIIIVCSGGQNNVPGPSLEVLLDMLKKKDITVLSLTSFNYEDTMDAQMPQVTFNPEITRPDSIHRILTNEAKEARKLMKKLADESGGFSFFPKNNSKLNESIQQIRSILRGQYVLSYKPESHSKSNWRKIEVNCKRKGAKLKYRKGYFME